MNKKLNLTHIDAFTVYSSDNEMSSSEKGVYQDHSIATEKAKRSGWYGSDGEVRYLDDIYQDKYGELYKVKFIGEFTDVAKKKKEETMANIKAKLTKEELDLLGIK